MLPSGTRSRRIGFSSFYTHPKRTQYCWHFEQALWPPRLMAPHQAAAILAWKHFGLHHSHEDSQRYQAQQLVWTITITHPLLPRRSTLPFLPSHTTHWCHLVFYGSETSTTRLTSHIVFGKFLMSQYMTYRPRTSVTVTRLSYALRTSVNRPYF